MNVHLILFDFSIEITVLKPKEPQGSSVLICYSHLVEHGLYVSYEGNWFLAESC